MAELTDTDIADAVRRGDVEARTKPRAASARCDAARDRVVVDSVNGSIFAFPSRFCQGLETASESELADVEVSASGIGLRWPARAADFTVAGLLAGWFGTRRYVAECFGPEWSVAAA